MYPGHTGGSLYDVYLYIGEVYPGHTGGSLYDGQQQVLYWADVSTEVAFVVPSPDTYGPNITRNTSGIVIHIPSILILFFNVSHF